MVDALSSSPRMILDVWVRATWDVFLAICDRPEVKNAQCYYDAGWMRIEKCPRQDRNQHHRQERIAIVLLIVLL